jgi:LmbE family N-acetylglucosaminyl deacetylase
MEIFGGSGRVAACRLKYIRRLFERHTSTSHLIYSDRMIVPIATQEDWRSIFLAARPWTPPCTRTVVIAPHPDDESLAVGGLTAAITSAGAGVQVLAVTDGENAYAGETGFGRIRVQEQQRALQALGVNSSEIFRLGLPDSGVAAHEPELTDSIRSLVTPDTHVIAPWPGDFHPDHESCGRAAMLAADYTGATVTFYFFWTWHRGTPSLLRNLPLLRFELSVDQQRAKAQAICCHESQLVHSSCQPILPDSLLWPARQPFEVFLPK